jgi:hypothetical protein
MDNHVWEPVRTVLSQYQKHILAGSESLLVHRLARANMRRRNNLLIGNDTGISSPIIRERLHRTLRLTNLLPSSWTPRSKVTKRKCLPSQLHTRSPQQVILTFYGLWTGTTGLEPQYLSMLLRSGVLNKRSLISLVLLSECPMRIFSNAPTISHYVHLSF